MPGARAGGILQAKQKMPVGAQKPSYPAQKGKKRALFFRLMVFGAHNAALKTQLALRKVKMRNMQPGAENGDRAGARYGGYFRLIEAVHGGNPGDNRPFAVFKHQGMRLLCLAVPLNYAIVLCHGKAPLCLSGCCRWLIICAHGLIKNSGFAFLPYRNKGDKNKRAKEVEIIRDR